MAKITSFDDAAKGLKSRKPEKRLLVATDFGAKGDGTTDDTAALQAWMDAAGAGGLLGLAHTLYLPAGRYRTTATLNFPGTIGTALVGEGKQKSIFRPDGDFACIHLGVDNSHSQFFRDFKVDYSPQYDQPRTTPAATAFLYGVDGGSMSGFYHHHWRSIEVNCAYRSWALKQGDQMQTLWRASWDDIRVTHSIGAPFSFKPDVPIGMPGLNFRNIGIFNLNGAALNKAKEPAFDMMGAEVNLDGLDLEGWNDVALYNSGGTHFTARNVHIEWHHFTKPQAWAFHAADGPMEVDGWSMADAKADSTNDASTRIGYTEGNGTLTLRNGRYGVDCSTSESYVRGLAWGGAPGSVIEENVTVAGGDVPLLGLGDRALETAATRLPSPPQQVEAIDSSTTISVAWEIVRCTGSITVTLPSPATSPVGKVYTILNAGSGTVTLAGALNGPSSVSANSARRVMSSGSGWDVF